MALLAVRPDYVVEVRKGILEEDGPMLLQGLKEIHGTRIWTPRAAAQKPDTEILSVRYERSLTG